MSFRIDRRAFLKSQSALAAATLMPDAFAQAKIPLLYTESASAEDIRAKVMMDQLVPAIASEFELKPYFNSTLFKQGTELLAMQRGNLDMSALSIPDFQRQIPAWGIVGNAYVFRDMDHMFKVYNSDVGKQLFKMAEDIGIKILSVHYIGTRHVSLRVKKKINTPADMAGIRLRMPAGEGWQFLGECLGANPTPIPFAEVYAALQTGAIDGQDNPMPLTKTMKFYEVLSQYILTGHLINCNLFSIAKKKWDSLTPAQQTKLQTASTEYSATVTKQFAAEEKELAAFFKSQGLDVYTPDLAAFQKFALDKTKKSKYIKEWVPGMLEKIEAM
ncbi:MAG: DctP family TRAP transporter solute-binding subunit [Burkholderiales bacterium]|nr:DctP family TRAP transporter solute-binding subunit [Burkholderiales bacterium]